MQDGEYIVDRWMVKMLRDICAERGVSFDSYSDDWLLELKFSSKTHRVFGYRFDLNDSVSASVAQDKVATYQVLAKASIPAVPHVLVRTKVSHADRKVMGDWQKVVIKPLVGTSGHGVHLFDNIDAAIAHIEESPIAAWAAAPFIDIIREIRVILLNGVPLLIYEKQPVTIRGLKMFNLGLGATPKDIEISDELLQLAISAQKELCLRLSTIDIVEDGAGESRVLEINDSIMMEHYARHSPENKQRAAQVYSAIVNAMMR
jgi:glutathione synthase/RimK-type ligase-like ATP-grasp enzyme